MDKIVIIDYGSQYNQLISRRIREMRVYSEIIPYHAQTDWTDPNIKGIILSGGPNSVYDQDAPALNDAIFSAGVPVLGICYGMQLLMQFFGGRVAASHTREYGRSSIKIADQTLLLDGVGSPSVVWMSHGDRVEEVPEGFAITAKTDTAIAAVENPEQSLYGVQFHLEVTHTEEGETMLRNFIFGICEAKPDWDLSDFIQSTITSLRQEIDQEKVILGLSGGVDSSVAAALLHKAVGPQLTCIFVDTGLLRYGEAEEVMQGYGHMPELNVVLVDAKERFFKALKGVTDPEEKRKRIGALFIRVFEEAKQSFNDVKYLAQGTIYPDVIESISVHGPSQTIKSHHNVGGLPDKHTFQLIEPLRLLFKDEVRDVGLKLGLSEELVHRHPFPGPGLAIRILGEVSPEKTTMLQHADRIFIEELRRANLYHKVSQAFVTLLPVKTVGVMGDQRTYEYVAALRSVNTTDFMTAHISRLPYDFLEMVATRIINEVKGINRIVYDMTSKPPGTIEWE